MRGNQLAKEKIGGHHEEPLATIDRLHGGLGERWRVMMVLRYVLMIATMAMLGFIAYLFATQGNLKTASERVVVYSFVIGLILNLVYLYKSQPPATGKPSRLARLVGLWLGRVLINRPADAGQVMSVPEIGHGFSGEGLARPEAIAFRLATDTQ
jgi:hypothetical protein